MKIITLKHQLGDGHNILSLTLHQLTYTNMIIEEKIKILIQKLGKEKNSNCFFITSSQLTKLLSLLSSMLDNLLINSNKSIRDISSDINLIMRWSIDEWTWNTLTKEIVEIIEEYEKLEKLSKKIIEEYFNQ